MAYRFLWAPVIFIVGYLLLRFAGKRAVANMTNYDLFMVAAIGATLGDFLTDHDSFLKTIFGAALLAGTYYGFSKLMLLNKARNILMEKPSVLIHKGRINEVGMRTARITVPELLSHLRLKGYNAIADVEFAIMEEAGDISVIPKASARPVEVRDLHLQVKPAERVVPVIIDGEWIEQNLKAIKRDKKYVIMQLQAQGYTEDQIGRLTLVTVDESGQIWLDVAHDQSDDSAGVVDQYNSLEQASSAVLPQQHADGTQDGTNGTDGTSEDPVEK